jgi:Predicted transcriptional regulators
MFYDTLKRLREERGLSRKDVSMHLKIHESTYGKYELGQRQPSFEITQQLANYFNVSVDYLLSSGYGIDEEKKHLLDVWDNANNQARKSALAVLEVGLAEKSECEYQETDRAAEVNSFELKH